MNPIVTPSALDSEIHRGAHQTRAFHPLVARRSGLRAYLVRTIELNCLIRMTFARGMKSKAGNLYVPLCSNPTLNFTPFGNKVSKCRASVSKVIVLRFALRYAHNLMNHFVPCRSQEAEVCDS